LGLVAQTMYGFGLGLGLVLIIATGSYIVLFRQFLSQPESEQRQPMRSKAAKESADSILLSNLFKNYWHLYINKNICPINDTTARADLR
jgi:hypothetical protein